MTNPQKRQLSRTSRKEWYRRYGGWEGILINSIYKILAFIAFSEIRECSTVSSEARVIVRFNFSDPPHCDTVIDQQAHRAQKMFPHYFEKYKTDGVDYKIYVGASLQGGRNFDPLYLRNLRLWQLVLICGVHWELGKVCAVQGATRCCPYCPCAGHYDHDPFPYRRKAVRFIVGIGFLVHPWW